MNKGSYALLIKLNQEISLKVGSLGQCSFPPGFYIYIGSARKGLKTRIARHQRKERKRIHWHIDYLLAHPEAKIQEIYTFPLPQADECSLVQRLKEINGAQIVVPGFGSSDCRKGCCSHLLYFSKLPALNPLEKWLHYYLALILPVGQPNRLSICSLPS